MLGDRYRLDDRIAAGGMGEVWQATDTVLGRDVAVKTLHTDREGDPGFQMRFRHEARAMAVLHHPNVADVFDYGESGADAYIVMARVAGEPLSRRIAERGRLSAAETMSVVAQAAHALDAAHQAGIVHRDVKPGNLIMQPDGAVVLVDFGVARSAESPSLTGASEVVGTALYIAPEQVSKQITGPAADIYALGAVAYHCLAGRPPFLGDNPITVALHHLEDDPPELPPDVPGPVRALVATAMAKDAAARFPSAAALADAAEATAATVRGTTPDGAMTAAAGTPAAYQVGRAGSLTGEPEAPAARTMPVRRALADGETALLPTAASPAKRRRGAALAGMLGLLTLAAIVAVLAFASPGNLFPGGSDQSTTAPPSAGTGGAPVSPNGDATDHGAGAIDNGGTNTGSTASSTGIVRPTGSAGASGTATTSIRQTGGPTTGPRSTGASANATTSVTRTRSPATSPRPGTTTTHTTATPSPKSTSTSAPRTTAPAAVQGTTATNSAANTP
jgi:eukaryotic-like serine/threonine-protein kinase